MFNFLKTPDTGSDIHLIFDTSDGLVNCIQSDSNFSYPNAQLWLSMTTSIAVFALVAAFETMMAAIKKKKPREANYYCNTMQRQIFDVFAQASTNHKFQVGEILRLKNERIGLCTSLSITEASYVTPSQVLKAIWDKRVMQYISDWQIGVAIQDDLPNGVAQIIATRLAADLCGIETWDLTEGLPRYDFGSYPYERTLSILSLFYLACKERPNNRSFL